MVPAERFGRAPVLAGEPLGLLVLDHATDVGRYAVHRAVGGDHVYLHATAVNQLRRVHLVGEEDAPDAELVAGQQVRLVVPAVEIADQMEGVGFRGPLAVIDPGLPLALAAVEAEVVMPVTDRRQRAEAVAEAA